MRRGGWDKVDRRAETLRKQRKALLGEGFEPAEPNGARVRATFTDPTGEICANLPHMRSRVGTIIEADDFPALLAKAREIVG